jgi:GTP 3',8-cyclase
VLDIALDGHKLHLHPHRVADWVEGKAIQPLYVEISPVAHCNHKCVFCNYNYLGHKGFFPAGRLLTLPNELAVAGIKAVVFAGAGEPCLHPETFDAIERVREQGMDVAMSTNGALLNRERIDAVVRHLTWIRFSCSGGSPENYALVHRGHSGDYDTVMANIRAMRRRKDETGSALTIGAQFILLPENKDFLLSQARAVREAGADYFVVKHFYAHTLNAYQPDMSFLTPDYLMRIEDAARALSDASFSCIVRGLAPLDRRRPYRHCEGLPFLMYIAETGDAFMCFSHQEDLKTSFGNVMQGRFEDLCRSEDKTRAMAYINSQIDKDLCQENCRHHRINLFLHALGDQAGADNFLMDGNCVA